MLGQRGVLGGSTHQLIRVIKQRILRQKILMAVRDELVDARSCWDVFFESGIVRRHVSWWGLRMPRSEAILGASTLVGIVVRLHNLLDGELQNAAGALRLALTDFRIVGFVIDA